MIERDGKLAPVKNQGTALQQAALDTNGCCRSTVARSWCCTRLTLDHFTQPTCSAISPRGSVFPVGKRNPPV